MYTVLMQLKNNMKSLFRADIMNFRRLAIFVFLMAFFSVQLSAECTAPDVIAEVEGRCVTMDDIQNNEIYEMRKTVYERLKGYYKTWALNELAKNNPEYKYVKYQPTVEEINSYYKGSWAIVAGKVSDPEVRKQITAAIIYQKGSAQLEKLYQKALAKGLIIDYFKAPKAFKILAPWDSTRSSNPFAKHAVILYLDYSCTYCAIAWMTIKKAIKDFPDISLSVYHYPKSGDGLSYQLALGAECARDQDMFTQYSDLVLKNINRIKVNQILEIPDMIKMDKDLFNQCYESKKKERVINFDLIAAKELSIPATPTLLIGKINKKLNLVDSRMFVGAISYGALMAHLNHEAESTEQ